ncbi:MAG TPA: lysophospholipid acyltransferase family protein [Flavobacteriales bacterium]|nr:lysophospholipid acyltransferase family protein [Flavobacteriales bacterium]
MKAVGFYILLPIIYLFMLIPYPFFYGLCDFIFFVVYYVVGYRKKVVFQNLRNAFPEKSDEEIKKIRRKFYRHLCDVFLEMFKTLTIRRSVMIKRCKISPSAKALFDELAAQNKSFIAILGHWGNWEWASSTFPLQCKHQLYMIYHPIRNPHFEWLTKKLRTRFGNKVVPMNDTFKTILANRDELNVFGFIGDQTPPPEGAYWTTFLNQDTPVYNGTEKIARKLNRPVVYISIKKYKRGHYEVFAETLFEHPAQTTEGEITETHTRRLEKDILSQPETWLWSHRRWKHSRKK